MGQEAPHQNGSRPPKSEKTPERNGHQNVGGYRLLREIDTDSLGSVYEAEHPRLHRRVALRTIGTGVARDVSFSRRFLLELRSYTALEHEAIPRVYELAYDGESPYLVTELVAGTTFDGMLGDGQRYEPLGIIDLLRPVASALDYAHSRATVHRDVKPANILLADDGRTVLTGFGLGAVASFNGGAAGPVAPEYVAPERLVGREVDGRADVYSLAAVIFEATTGRRPFSSKSWIETLSRRLYEPPPDVRDVAPDLPPAFAAALQQAMDRDPARRPATAGELLEKLEASITSRNGSVAVVARQLLEPVRHVRSIGIGAALIVIVGAGEVVWLFQGSGLALVQHTLQRLFGAG